MKITNPMLRLGLTITALAMMSFGCNTESDTRPGDEATEVRIGYFANFTHAQGVLGISSGEFAAAVAPAKISTKVFNAGPSLIEALFAGEIDLAYVGPGPALNAHDKSRGEGVRIIAGAANNGVLIVARKDAGIATLADLPGRKIATPQHGNTQDISARHYLKERLKQDNLSNVLPVPNAEQVAMMSRGQIDASWAPEPWASWLIAETGATRIAAESDLWPNQEFTLTVVVTTPRFLAEHPELVEKFLAVHRSWTQRLQEEPDKYGPQLAEALFALTNKKLPEGVLSAALANVKFTDEPIGETFSTYAKWSYDLGFAKRPIDTQGLIDTTLLEKLRRDPALNQVGDGAGAQ